MVPTRSRHASPTPPGPLTQIWLGTLEPHTRDWSWVGVWEASPALGALLQASPSLAAAPSGSPCPAQQPSLGVPSRQVETAGTSPEEASAARRPA